MLGRTAYAAALTGHALDKVFRELSDFQEGKRRDAFLSARAGAKLDIGGVFSPTRMHSITAFATPPEPAKFLPQSEASW